MKRPVFTGLALTSILALLPLTSCKKDEPPPPLPSAAPVVAPPPQQVELQPIAEAVPDAAVAATVKKGAGGKPASVSACCAALEQNAASAPEPNATYMKQAAAFCKAQGGSNPAIIGMLQGMLKGAGLPASCK
jgi:hypothetical protein